MTQKDLLGDMPLYVDTLEVPSYYINAFFITTRTDGTARIIFAETDDNKKAKPRVSITLSHQALQTLQGAISKLKKEAFKEIE